MIQASHYIEQYRQNGKDRIINSPIQELKKITTGLNLTKSSNCKTVAVWKIQFKPGYPIIKTAENE